VKVGVKVGCHDGVKRWVKPLVKPVVKPVVKHAPCGEEIVEVMAAPHALGKEHVSEKLAEMVSAVCALERAQHEVTPQEHEETAYQIRQHPSFRGLIAVS
jgi:hypothetical protein